MKLAHRAWRMIRHDIGRKLTAFALALGVWFVLENLVLAEQKSLLEVKVVGSVEEADGDRLTAARSTLYVVVPDTLQVRLIQPQTLRLNLKGEKDDVRNLVVFATIEFFDSDLKGEDEATLERTLGRDNFKGRDRNPELTLFRINGDVSKAVLVTLARKTVVTVTLGPANVLTSGHPAQGYHVDTGRILVKQYQVDVSGPRTLVEKYRTDPTALKLAPVAIEGAKRTVSQVVGLPVELAALKLSQSAIEVTVPIVEDDQEVTLVSLPITYKNVDALAKKGFKRVGNPPEKCDIRVRGPAPDLRAFTTDQLAKHIDLVFDYADVDLADGINREPLSVFLKDLPDSVHVYGTDALDENPKIEFKLERLPGGP